MVAAEIRCSLMSNNQLLLSFFVEATMIWRGSNDKGTQYIGVFLIMCSAPLYSLDHTAIMEGSDEQQSRHRLMKHARGIGEYESEVGGHVTMLRFHACLIRCEIFVDGKKVAEFVSGYAPVEVDVGALYGAGGSNYKGM